MDKKSKAEDTNAIDIEATEKEPLDPKHNEVNTLKDENPNQGVLYYLVNNHMWIFAIWLIPISVCYDIFWFCRTRIKYWLCKRNVNIKHEDKVSQTPINQYTFMCRYLILFN